LSLVRDRIGKKPLFWYRRGNLLLFGSQMKALMSNRRFQRDLNQDAVAAYLRLAYVPSPTGIFFGFEKLAPGTLIQFRQDGSIARNVYWDLGHCAESGLRNPRSITLDNAVEEADALLRDAAIKQTLSDVPLGVFLSGGIDSSLVTALLQTQVGSPVRTYSVGFAEQDYNEAGHARAIANHLGTDHTEMTVTVTDALNVVPKLSDWFDEPFADSSQIPTHLLSALTRRHVTVALSGDGGDEIAAGYVRHGRSVIGGRRSPGCPSRYAVSPPAQSQPHRVRCGMRLRPSCPRGYGRHRPATRRKNLRACWRPKIPLRSIGRLQASGPNLATW
jgi:asparagine synthase (glutamine-hydrolysing)